MQWPEEKVFKLIDVYRNHEILWNPSNKNYFNKILKSDAWVEVSEEMDNLPIEDLKRKIETLLGQLRREKAKMKKTRQGADERCASSWYAYEHLRFLLDRNKPRKRLNIETNNDVSVTQDEQVSDTESQSSQSTFKRPVSKKEKLVTVEDQMKCAFDLLATATAAVKDATSKAIAASQPTDEDQLYANFIASKFRMYSQRTKNALQHQISNLLFQADNGHFDLYQPQPPYGYASQPTTSPIPSRQDSDDSDSIKKEED